MTATNRPTRTDIAISQASAAHIIVNMIRTLHGKYVSINAIRVDGKGGMFTTIDDEDETVALAITIMRDSLIGLQPIPSE